MLHKKLTADERECAKKQLTALIEEESHVFICDAELFARGACP